MEALLNLDQAAELLNLSKSCLYRLTERGELPSVRVLGVSKVLFRKADLMKAVRPAEPRSEA
jgi:excisionase family DNA binding protein